MTPPKAPSLDRDAPRSTTFISINPITPSTHLQKNQYIEKKTYLPPSLQTHPPQRRTDRIHSIQEVPEQRNILLFQNFEVIIVHVGSEISVRYWCTDILDLRNNSFHGLKEIHSDEFHPRVNPRCGQGTSRGDDDFGPWVIDDVREDDSVVRSDEG